MAEDLSLRKQIWRVSYPYANVDLVVCSDHAFDLVTPTTDVQPLEGDHFCEFCKLIEISDRWKARIPPGS